MFNRLLTRCNFRTRLVLAIALCGCLAWLALTFFRGHRRESISPEPATTTLADQASSGQDAAPTKMEGAAARQYLEQTSEGQSLMQAVMTAQYGLKWQQKSPLGESAAGGYLGMSHDQNLNAWFDDEGATIRPTLAQKDRDRTWQLGFKLKGYGYGETLPAAPPIVARNVVGTRIEYQRTDCRLTISNCRFEPEGTSALRGRNAVETSGNTVVATSGFLQSAIGNRQSTITEWYENRREGFEQGFTINVRPERSADVAAREPLRLGLALAGDLRARVLDKGKEIELVDKTGNAVLSYRKLIAVDADGKLLASRLEASVNGREIALVVEDEGARYPIVIDPIVATLEERLDAGSSRQTGAQSGWAVAIEGNNAVVGSPTYDITTVSIVDGGLVTFFVRTGSSWTSTGGVTGSHLCGYSVAISSGKAVYGCPGVNGNTGEAFIYDFGSGLAKPLKPGVNLQSGNFFGASVAINYDSVVVGAPFFNGPAGPLNLTQIGAVHVFDLNGVPKITPMLGKIGGDNFGISVALANDTLVVGAPGVDVNNGGTTVADAGAAYVYLRGPNATYNTLQQLLVANDPHSGIRYAANVAISGETAVIAASADGDKGSLAGAVYVFVRNVATWTLQQKIYGNDTKAGDRFGFFAVAIEGNTMVVGANKQDCGCDPPQPEDNRGAAYVFTRIATVWTQQTRISPSGAQGGAPGNLFGFGVGISGDTVIVGATAADVSGTTDAGAAYVYRLDCVAPFAPTAWSAGLGQFASTNRTLCPGEQTILFSSSFGSTGALNYQWRKNGEIIPGAIASAYSISNASPSDAGIYDVIVANACGSDISNPVTIGIHTFTLSPNQNFSASGSPGILNVTSAGNCGWAAVSNSSFITITSGQTGTAPGNIGFTVAPNPGPNQRTGTITVGDKTFTVTQDGLNCSYSISPTTSNFSAGSGSSSVNVTATAGCAWTANSNDAWLTITSGSNGTGNGTVNYSVAVNNGPARTGTLTVAGQTVTVTQANGCTYFLTPSSQTFPPSFAAGAVNVNTANGCTWTAVSNSSFITVTSGANGSGNGTVGYSLTANDTTSQRNGTVTIAGQTFMVTQDGAEPAPTPSPSPSPLPSPSPIPSPSPSPNPSPSPTPAPSPSPSPSPAPSPSPTPVPNVVQFDTSNYNIQEDCTFVTVTVNRVGDTSGAAGIDYSTSDVSATERRDYITALGTLRFAAGETSKSFAILINEDSFVEGNETFSVTLSNPSGVSLGGPAIATVTITDDAGEPAANPIDDAQNYVCQHYHDFLNRQPDASGLQFWTNQITACGSDQACIETRRINVSASFFLSIEFQDTGYLVERIYKTAYGSGNGNSTFPSAHQLPVPVARLNEFLADTQEIGQGVIVGEGNWQQQLENNKQAFTAAFVLRSRFTTALPTALAAAQFVDTLNANAGNPLSPSERNQLVNDLTTNTKTRAQVLRAVAEDSDLNIAESNRAFVLMQYFGYLRRNPNDPQDSDHTGYDFWLTKLNQFNGNYINAEMVKAFITSIEYRQRFGP